MCTLAKGFTLTEKIYAQTSFFAMAITGTIAICISDPIYVIPYVFIVWYGIPGIIQRHIVCPRCPHLHQYGDCLQLPSSLTRMLIKKPKKPKLKLWERYAFLAIFTLIPAYPLYWVYQTPILLILFLVSAALWYGGQFFYFCKHCRVKHCPLNRVKWVA